ncbi:trifunctional dihydropteroate synthetase [Agyrium rufum]|nr:trifunctional dihydropteroate synthetase [Agyrium rufum]
MSLPTEGTKPRDCVVIRDIRFIARIGKDCWGRDEAQQARTTIKIWTDTSAAAAGDDVLKTYDYGAITKHFFLWLGQAVPWENLHEFHSAYFFRFSHIFATPTCLEMTTWLPDALLRVDSGHGLRTTFNWFGGLKDWKDTFMLPEVNVNCIIGVKARERTQKQKVKIGFEIVLMYPPNRENQAGDPFEVLVQKAVEDSSYQTVEALAEMIARMICLDAKRTFTSVTVTVEKPSALNFADGAGVEITRTPDQYS